MSAYDQTKGELCDKCGWAMKFPGEPCRCELERENAALKAKRAVLISVVESLVEVSDVPAPNCSCHLSAPCSDCVDYGAIREAIEQARAAIDAARKEGTP